MSPGFLRPASAALAREPRARHLGVTQQALAKAVARMEAAHPIRARNRERPRRCAAIPVEGGPRLARPHCLRDGAVLVAA